MGGIKTETPPVLLASAERSATTSTDDIRSMIEELGGFFVLDVTKAPPKAREVKEKETKEEEEELAAEKAAAEGTLAVAIEAKDEISGKYIVLTAFAATKKASELEKGVTLAFTVYPGAAETAAIANHEVQALPLPRDWRVTVTHSKGGKWTYSLSYQPLSS